MESECLHFGCELRCCNDAGVWRYRDATTGLVQNNRGTVLLLARLSGSLGRGSSQRAGSVEGHNTHICCILGGAKVEIIFLTAKRNEGKMQMDAVGTALLKPGAMP